MDNYIVGRNAVKEALKAGRSIQRILVSDDKIKTGLHRGSSEIQGGRSSSHTC